jgi:hypothetical protein
MATSQGGACTSDFLCLLYAAALLSILCGPAEARVTGIVIDSRSPAFANQTFGNVGRYELLRGRIFGEVDPTDRHNTIIQDGSLAPRNERGHVAYISTFTLLKPVDDSKANGVLFYEVPNRGTSLQSTLSDGDPGNGFFYRRGYIVLSAGWQGDLTPVPTADLSATSIPIESIAVPRASNRDSSAITRPFLVRIPKLEPVGQTGNLAKLDQGGLGPSSYLPATFDTAQASLTKAPGETIRGMSKGKRLRMASTDWMWADCLTGEAPGVTMTPSNLCIKLLNGTFDSTLVYTLIFRAKDPLVLGIGLAATRDIVSFFRYAEHDDSGAVNPIFGMVPHVLGQGISQTSQFVRTFIRLGFNEDEAGRIVWDGVNTHIGGRELPVNFRFAIPGGVAGLYEPSIEGILSWGSAPDPVRHGEPASLLDRCHATNTCPKIFETFGSNELWYGRMSLGLAGTDGRHDIPLPPNVRRYYFPGTQHEGGEGGFYIRATESRAEDNLCLLPLNPNPETETMRALLVALTAWVTEDTMPPDSRYPTLAGGLLKTDTKNSLKFPTIPGVHKPYGLANPMLDYDFGPHFNTSDMSGYVDYQPPNIRQVVPVLVAGVDSDGNEQSGVASVLHKAPLGTYLGWNITATGVYAGQICNSAGSFAPFAKTRADRLRLGDSRLSIEERYGDRQGYLCAVEGAIRGSMKNGFLLEEDAQRLNGEARAATVCGDLSFLPAAPTSRGMVVCGHVPVDSYERGDENCARVDMPKTIDRH